MTPVNLFSFEREKYADLNWIPLALRYRLDVCGIKLSLAAWQKLSFSDRLQFLDDPFEVESERNVWATRLRKEVADVGGELLSEIDQWMDPQTLSPDLAKKFSELEEKFDSIVWPLLKPLERYALCKLALGKTEERFFSVTAREFGASKP